MTLAKHTKNKDFISKENKNTVQQKKWHVKMQYLKNNKNAIAQKERD